MMQPAPQLFWPVDSQGAQQAQDLQVTCQKLQAAARRNSKNTSKEGRAGQGDATANHHGSGVQTQGHDRSSLQGGVI